MPLIINRHHLLLIVVMLCQMQQSNSKPYTFNFTITPLSQAGIFYEDRGLTQSAAGHFTLLSFINLTFYETQYQTIKHVYSESKPLCDKLSKAHILPCRSSLSIVNNEINKISSKFETIQHLTLGSTRKRRGLINGVSTALKWLIGTPDASDAKFYDDAINSVLSQNHDEQQLLQNQMQLISSAVDSYNESLSSFKLNEDKFNTNFQRFNKFASTYETNEILIENFEILADHMNLVSRLIADLNERLDSIINSILFARNGVIHPMVIKPGDFRNELIKLHTDSNLRLPLVLNATNINVFYSLSKIKVAHSSDNLLIFFIQLPLTEKINFRLYKLIPLPIYNPLTHTHVFIVPSHPYLLMSLTRDKFALLGDLSACETTQEVLRICQGVPIYQVSDETPCEVVLKTEAHKTVPRNCKTLSITTKIEIFHRIAPTQWLFVTSNEISVTITCKNTLEVAEVTLKNTGIIKIPSRCQCKTPSTELIAYEELTSEFVHYVPPINISAVDASAVTQINSLERLEAVHLRHVSLDDLRKVISIDHSMVDNLKNPLVKHLSNPAIPWTVVLLIIVCIGGYLFHSAIKQRRRAARIVVQPPPTPMVVFSTPSKEELPTGTETDETTRKSCDNPQNYKNLLFKSNSQ